MNWHCLSFNADLCIHFYWLSQLRQASHKKKIQSSALKLWLWLCHFKISSDTLVFRPNSNLMMSTISIYQLIHDLRQGFFLMGVRFHRSFGIFLAFSLKCWLLIAKAFLCMRGSDFIGPLGSFLHFIQSSKSAFLYFLQNFLCISQRDILMVKNFWFKCVVDSPLRQN